MNDNTPSPNLKQHLKSFGIIHLSLCSAILVFSTIAYIIVGETYFLNLDSYGIVIYFLLIMGGLYNYNESVYVHIKFKSRKAQHAITK